MTVETPQAPAPRRRNRRRRAHRPAWAARFLEAVPPARAASLALGLISALAALWNRHDLEAEAGHRAAVVDTLRAQDRGAGADLARLERELGDLRGRLEALERERARTAPRRRELAGVVGPPAPAGDELERPGPVRRLLGFLTAPFRRG